MKKKILLLITVIVVVILISAAVGAHVDTEMELFTHLGQLFGRTQDPGTVLAAYQEYEVTAEMVAYQQETVRMANAAAEAFVQENFGSAEEMSAEEKAAINAQLEQMRQEVPDQAQCVDSILTGYVLVEEAKRVGVAATDEEVAQAMEAYKSVVAENPDQTGILQVYWEAAGLTEDEYWSLLEESVYREISAANLKSVTMSEYESQGMTEEEAEAAFQTYKAELLEQAQEEITYYMD